MSAAKGFDHVSVVWSDRIALVDTMSRRVANK